MTSTSIVLTPLSEYFAYAIIKDTQYLFQMRHFAPALARLYFKQINVPILNWRNEIQILTRNIFSAFRFLLNSVDWLNSADKEKVQEKVDDITFNPGIPLWIDNDTQVMQRIITYNTSLNPFENEFRGYEVKLDRSMNKLISEDVQEQDDSETHPSFEPMAYYYSDQNHIDMYMGQLSFYTLQTLSRVC